MSIVIGKGKKIYDVPEDILTKYEVPEDKAKEIRANLKKESDQNDVEGYGLTVIDMGSGQTSNWGVDMFPTS